MLNKIKKAYQLGYYETLQAIARRSRFLLQDTIQRQRAYAGVAQHQWADIAQKHELNFSFAHYFDSLQKQKNILPYFSHIIFEKSVADDWVENTYNVLGAHRQKYESLPWHKDIRLAQIHKELDTQFDAHMYYKDIHIKSGDAENFAKDIKLPWETSRFQQVVILGNAYQKTGKTYYANAFKQQVTDWLAHNKYLFGVNWVCPMDVGIRAVNWIVGFYYFNSAIEDEAFWQCMTASLYDHFMYLEHNWEVYDSFTSNHYLADLIGYFFLATFFQDLSGVEDKLQWCYQELLKEFEKQVFDEGTNYEGSTHYHKLVTEIFYLFFLQAKNAYFVIPNNLEKKLRAMFNFLDWCSPINGSLIQIGDNDSGKIITGIDQKLIDQTKLIEEGVIKKDFPAFGLSILKTVKWHISLRHHSYDKKQPSGHFHADVASITLSVNGIPVFVDPGSYVYTPSAMWRNHFRSAQVHNSFFIKEEPFLPVNDQLFFLDVPDYKNKIEEAGDLTITTAHNLYAHLGLTAKRTITLQEEQNIVTVEDSWHGKILINTPLTTMWNFTLAPTIEVAFGSEGVVLLHEGQPLLTMQTELAFDYITGWYSPSYGTKVETKRLYAQRALMDRQPALFKLTCK